MRIIDDHSSAIACGGHEIETTFDWSESLHRTYCQIGFYAGGQYNGEGTEDVLDLKVAI